jgi:uncharacterized protein YjiK
VNNLHKKLACWAISLCLLAACQPNISEPNISNHYKLTSYPLVDVKCASGLTYAWGSLWIVADGESQVVYRLTTAGKLQGSFKLNLAPDSPLLAQRGVKLKHKGLDLEGIAADEGRELLYVISEANRLVLKVTPQGELVDLFPIQGHDTRPNEGLEGIAFSASEDRLYVVEEGPVLGVKKIYGYTPAGKQVGVHQVDVNFRLTGLCFYEGVLLAVHSAYPLPARDQILRLEPPPASPTPRVFVDLEQEFGLSQNYEGIGSDDQGNIYLINDSYDYKESQLIKLSPTDRIVRASSL